MRPELVFALVGPLGTRLEDLSRQLESELHGFGYEPIKIRLSDLLRGFPEWTDLKIVSAYDRVLHLQNVANEVRIDLKDGAALARSAIIEIRRERAKRCNGNPDGPLDAHAFILEQLKHPAEAELLRKVYGDSFYLIGGHACHEGRIKDFARLIAKSLLEPGQENAHVSEASNLILRDDSSDSAFGQNMRDTYPQADVFVDLNPEHGERELARFVDLIFGHPFHTPSPEEYSMYLASAVALRSSDRNRQVGAAIVDISYDDHPFRVRNADVRSVGMNEVPRAEGGFYWDKSTPDHRDQNLAEDRAVEIKVSILKELIGSIRRNGWLAAESESSDDGQLAQDWLQSLAGSHFMNIGEFSRPVHAELSAIIDAARRGVGIDKCSIFVTTYPCHNCAKHIIAAGLTRVFYLEPYPKSRAGTLYGEELEMDAPNPQHREGKVVFIAYSGVAPRQYGKLFSMMKRGSKSGLDRRRWNEQKKTLRPLYVPEHLQAASVLAERDALSGFQQSGYRWDPNSVCP